jgi:hypothetical protein
MTQVASMPEIPPIQKGWMKSMTFVEVDF